MKASPSLILSCLLAVSVTTASAQLVSYTDRSQVNLMNAKNAALAVSGVRDPYSQLNSDEARFDNEGNFGTLNMGREITPIPVATLDFGAIRNVKTVTVYDNLTNKGITAATVETSDDGSTWTPRSSMLTNVGTGTSSTIITLTSAVDARYVRVTPTAFSGDRWDIVTLRAFGDVGTMAGDTNLTIVANGAYSSAQTLSAVGTISQSSPGQMISPAITPYGRQLLSNIGNGEGFKLDLGQTFAVDSGTISLNNLIADGANPLVMTLSGSLDGTNFSPLYSKTYTSTNLSFDLFSFSFDQANAHYLQVTFTSAIATDTRVTDFAFFQVNPVPEPQTWALAALGASAILFRLRRKSRTP